MDWFEKGKAIVLSEIREETMLPMTQIQSVYASLVNHGLIDYDIEKGIFLKVATGEEM